MSELSPAAKAVDRAIADRIQLLGEIATSRQIAAAALRAAADQVVPGDGSRRANEIRSEFLAIATELENHQ